ncbi:hypothetical protein JL722_13867 [Aureococcus anophagefferens]|nr:hypothetical protein JL722_13867 [Aureococcus anophagefferens]
MNWRKDSRKAFGYAFLVGCAADHTFAPVASGSTIDSYGGAVAYASDGTYCYKVTIGDGVAYGGGEIIQNTGASSGCESLDYTVGGTDGTPSATTPTSGDDQNYDDGDYCPPITGSRTALLSLVVDDSATEQTSVTCGCLAVTKKRKCNRRAKCAWVGGSHKCLADCEVLTKESRCRKKRNCVYKSGACRFKHACAYKISHGKCEKASKCRVKKFAGAEKFDAHGQKMWLCEHREKAN